MGTVFVFHHHIREFYGFKEILLEFLWNSKNILEFEIFKIRNTHLPSPETSNEFKKRSSPALKVVMQSPDSKFIRFTYIRLRDKHTKCCASLQYAKYGIFWFITPFSVTFGKEKSTEKISIDKRKKDFCYELPEGRLCSNRWLWFHGGTKLQLHDYLPDTVQLVVEFLSEDALARSCFLNLKCYRVILFKFITFSTQLEKKQTLAHSKHESLRVVCSKMRQNIHRRPN